MFFYRLSVNLAPVGQHYKPKVSVPNDCNQGTHDVSWCQKVGESNQDSLNEIWSVEKAYHTVVENIMRCRQKQTINVNTAKYFGIIHSPNFSLIAKGIIPK